MLFILGHVDLITVLGNSKLVYDKQISEERSAEEYKKSLLENKDLKQGIIIIIIYYYIILFI
jgi:hypothetical protein